jgi:hypothetical protein
VTSIHLCRLNSVSVRSLDALAGGGAQRDIPLGMAGIAYEQAPAASLLGCIPSATADWAHDGMPDISSRDLPWLLLLHPKLSTCHYRLVPSVLLPSKNGMTYIYHHATTWLPASVLTCLSASEKEGEQRSINGSSFETKTAAAPWQLVRQPAGEAFSCPVTVEEEGWTRRMVAPWRKEKHVLR